jgi:UDP-glucuronate 4-epimerase
MLPMEAGDVAATCADTAALEPWIDFASSTPPSAGIVRLVDWSRHYYQV